MLSGTPLWVVRDYVPDSFITIVASAVTSAIGTVIAGIAPISLISSK